MVKDSVQKAQGAKTDGALSIAEIKKAPKGTEINDVVFRVSEKRTMRGKKGNLFARMRFSDRTGTIAGKNFCNSPLLSDAGADYARIWGLVDFYNGQNEIEVKMYEPLRSDQVNPSDFDMVSPIPINILKERFHEAAASLPDSLGALTSKVLAEAGDAFWNIPAGTSKHHAYRHGLLEHTLEVMDLAISTATIRNQNREVHGQRLVDLHLLRAAALLHDVGKAVELEPTPGGSWNYSVQGNMLRHIYLGAERVGIVAYGLGMAADKQVTLLKHLILSHHGEPQYGAAVEGMMEEAQILHLADQQSARGFMWAETEDQVEDFGWMDKRDGGRQRVVTRHFFEE